MTEIIAGQMSGVDAVAQAKFAAVYQAARQMQERISTGPVPFHELIAFPSEIIELLTKDPAGDE